MNKSEAFEVHYRDDRPQTSVDIIRCGCLKSVIAERTLMGAYLQVQG